MDSIKEHLQHITFPHLYFRVSRVIFAEDCINEDVQQIAFSRFYLTLIVCSVGSDSGKCPIETPMTLRSDPASISLELNLTLYNAPNV